RGRARLSGRPSSSVASPALDRSLSARGRHTVCVQVLAVDWSGRRERAEESIWLAAVRDGMLVSLENGRDREAIIAHVTRLAEATPRTVLGLDFAFSFPRWWCETRGWHDVREVWAAVCDEGERLLQTCRYPFWGRPGRPNPHPGERAYRRTE